MSDAIVRLRVESQEYDAKLKRATEGLTRYAEECRKMGGTLEFVEKETLDYVKALGQMDTVSRTATGSLSEMKKTYTELAVQYKKLTDEEKKSPFGKAMAQSLEELKGRIRESKGNIDDVTNSMNGGLSRAVENLTAKFGMNIKQLTGWGAALAAGKVALDVAKDAFNASEVSVDDWARTLDVGKSMYEGFLTALNTGDISGYLDRINEIVNAARLAYDELDRLGTMKTIQSPQKSSQQAENDRLRMMIQTGRYIAPLDGRRATMQNGQLLTPEQIKVLERQLQGGMQKMTNLVANEVKQSTRAINAVYDRQAKELGLTQKEFRAGTSSMAEFDKRIQGYQQYRAYERQHTIYDDRTGIGRRDTTTNPYESYKSWGVFRVDGDRYNQLVQLIQQRDQQMGQAYGMQSQGYRAINRVEGITSRNLMGSGGGGNAVQIDASKIEFVGGEGFKAEKPEFEPMMNTIDFMAGLRKEMGMDGEQTRDWGKELGQVFADYVADPDKEKRDKANKTDKDLVKNLSTLTSGISTLTSGIKGLGIDLPKEVDDVIGIITSLTSIIQGVQTIISIFGNTAMAANTAAIIANTAALTANTATNLLPFAHGGIVPHAANGYYVPGTHASGDVTPILANAGELVLNKSSQNNLANELKGAEALVQTIDRYQTSIMRGSQYNYGTPTIGGGMLGNMKLETMITGEQIRLVLNNNGRRTGRGEYITTNFK